MNKLETIVELASKAKTVADIGCDHGKVGLYLFKNGNLKRLIATDISPKCLQKSNDLFKDKSYDYEGRVGDGLIPIKNNEVDTIILAGMGGELIRDILLNDIEKTNSFNEFIVCPHTSPDLIRKTFCELNYNRVKDIIVREDDKYYFIMKYVKSDKDDLIQNEDDYLYPNSLKLQNPILFCEYIEHELEVKRTILEKIEDIGTDRTMASAKKIIDEIKYLEELC